MPLPPARRAEIEQLLANNAALQATLQNASDAAHAADILAAAAEIQGIRFEPAELVAYVAETHEASAATLADTQLEAIAGGRSFKPRPPLS